MPKLTPTATWALAAFGLLALAGLIALAAASRLTGGVETTLTAIAFGSLTGIAGVAIPGGGQIPPAPVAPPAP